MQKSAFCRYFKRKTKKRFMEFVNETRLAHAIKLLVETDKNILEIAFECGYESSSYFYRLFRKQNKVSPQEYRKQSNEKYIMNN
jgi:AraC-like DNA-binding protein